MDITVRELTDETIQACIEIWNDVVTAGRAFPQLSPLTSATGREFLYSQSYAGVASDDSSGQVLGMYILHPNNVGRCGHICNASYAVKSDLRGHHLGEYLVIDSMKQGKRLGFRILQFNAVVSSNRAALKLYQRLGFVQLGVIPGGFLNADGIYEDIIPHYHLL